MSETIREEEKMQSHKSLIKPHVLVIGLILMFLFTWPIDLSYAGLLPFRVPFAVWLFLGWGIVAASVLMTWLTAGRQAVGALLKRFLLWRVGWKWYLVLLLIPALDLLGLALYSAWSGTAPDFSTVYAYKIFGPEANVLLFIVPFLLTDAISNGEEIGWRGYVLPRLQTRHSALTSALIVGVIWGAWHLPKFLTHWDTFAFAVWMLDTLAKSILLAWVYNGTGGSLLLTTLMHAAYNTAGVFLPIANTTTSLNGAAFTLIVVLEIVVAAVIALAAAPAQRQWVQTWQVQQ